MKAVQRRSKLGVGVGAALLVAGFLLASSGVASAQSRAANRWNHVAIEARLSASTQGKREVDRVKKTIRLIEPFSDDFTFVDVGAPGDSPGDYGVFRDPVSSPRSGKVLGTIDVQCIAAYADQCRGSITLDGRGQITFDGVTPKGVDPVRFALTGGTGEFADASGVLIVSFPDDTSALLTLKLTD